MNPPLEIYSDFDGTITRGDTIDVLLERLADPSWKEVEQRWERGEIGSRECMALQVPLLRGGWQAVTEVLDDVEVDPTFAGFAKWCRQQGIPLRVVSDGIDRVIHYLLARQGIKVDFVWANRLVEAQDGSLSLLFPYAVAEKKICGSGVCKCKIVGNSRNPLKVVIGDGRSDFCWAGEADLLYAKSKLITHCQNNNLPYVAYEDFNAIRSSLEERLAELQPPVPQLVPQLIPTG